jgi:hypothetical protein
MFVDRALVALERAFLDLDDVLALLEDHRVDEGWSSGLRLSRSIFSISWSFIAVGRPAVPTKSPTPVVSLMRKKTSCGMRPSSSSFISTKT